MSDGLERLSAALADHYRIERELGAGGMATVFLAHDIKHDRQVAIKVLHPELAAVLGAERFLGEIKTTAKLQHPHILPLLDSGEAGGQLFYVMPLVDGEALRVRLERETQLPIGDAVRIAKEVAGALDYAHRHGVIHRDIKPENILLHDGSAIVADFGIALAVTAAGGQRLTQTGLSLGTPQYMSPEQAMGERAVDARSDIYSLGCVLYEMLAGAPPFTGPSAQAIVAKIITTEPGSVAEQRPTVPALVERAVRTSLQKLPADRFASAAQFADALDGRLDTVRDDAEPSRARSGPAFPGSFAWRRVFEASAFLALGAAAAWLVLRSRDGTAGPAATVRLSTPVPAALGKSLAISSDGGMIALSCGTPQRICVRRIGQLDLTPLAGTEEGLDPFFSPSGAWLAFVSGTRLKKVRLDGGPVVDLTAGFWEGGAWSPDDQLIYAPNSSTGLYRIPASGGAPQVLTAPDSARREVGHWWPQLLPDGHTVIFSDYAFPFKNSRIEAVDLRSRKRTVLVEGAVYGLYVKTGHLLFTRGTRTVYAVRLNTSTLKTEGEPVQVLDDVEILRPAGLSSFTVSDNGTLAYLPRSRWTPQTSLVWVDRSGKEEPLPLEPGDLSEPRISPDNKKVSFTRTDEHRDVWLFDRARSLATPFTRHEGEAFGSVWMPDSRRILYISERPGFEIYWRAADLGSPEERLPQSTGGDNVPISVSPDGKLLAYGEFALAAHIRFLALDGSATSITFPATPQSQWQPVFSPDGRWLAYTSDESGRAEVYVRPFPNLTGARQQVSTDGGGEARWSRAGREIIFRHGSRMMATSFDPAAGVPGRPVELFRGDYVQAYPVGSYSYDVTLDGNRFLMAKPQATGGRDVVIVVNWFAELARTLAKK